MLEKKNYLLSGFLVIVKQRQQILWLAKEGGILVFVVGSSGVVMLSGCRVVVVIGCC